MKQDTNDQNNQQVPWNKGKLIGQKSPLKLKEIWEIRIRLQMAKNTRELALFNLAIDSKLGAFKQTTELFHRFFSNAMAGVALSYFLIAQKIASF